MAAKLRTGATRKLHPVLNDDDEYDRGRLISETNVFNLTNQNQ